jgi:L-threonylcarbamoyladenylate synthase
MARAVGGYARRCWPGPFTLILPAGPGIPTEITGGGRTVALRVPALEALRRIVTGAGVPLVSTSANRAGTAAPVDLETAVELFGDEVDAVGELPSPPAEERQASALVDLTVWPPRVLRRGPRPLPSWREAQDEVPERGPESDAP